MKTANKDYRNLDSGIDGVTILVQSMWGFRVIQYGDAHAYALQEYRDDGQGVYGKGQVWFTIESSRLKSFIFKKFHEFSLDANPSPVV